MKKYATRPPRLPLQTPEDRRAALARERYESERLGSDLPDWLGSSVGWLPDKAQSPIVSRAIPSHGTWSERLRAFGAAIDREVWSADRDSSPMLWRVASIAAVLVAVLAGACVLIAYYFASV